jgi:hypothetical protein
MYRCNTPRNLLKLKEGEHGLKPSRVKIIVSCILFRGLWPDYRLRGAADLRFGGMGVA